MFIKQKHTSLMCVCVCGGDIKLEEVGWVAKQHRNACDVKRGMAAIIESQPASVQVRQRAADVTAS